MGNTVSYVAMLGLAMTIARALYVLVRDINAARKAAASPVVRAKLEAVKLASIDSYWRKNV